jgi:thioredoxin 1
MAIAHLDAGNFDQTISSGIVLVDFWATWCRPCLALAPILEKVEAATDATVAKVDVDKAQALAGKFNVRSIPTMILFKDGQPVDQMVGMHDEAAILALINKHKS